MAKRWLSSWGLIVAAALLLLLLPALASNYWMRVINIAIIYALSAVGLNLILGYTGQLSLGHAAFFGLGAYTTALLTVGRPGWLVWVTLPLAGAAAGLVALCIGFPALRLRRQYLALATVGFGETVRLVLINWDKVTRGPDGISNIPSPALFGLAFETNQHMYYLILVIAALLIAVSVLIVRSSYGRAMVAVRQNEIAAEAMGINVMGVKLLAFALSAIYAGIAGGLYAHTSNYISPENFGFDFTALSLMGLMIGGAGTLAGPVIGGILVTILPEGFRAFKAVYMLLFGTSVLAMIVTMPEGIIGLITRMRSRSKGVGITGSAAGD